MTPTLLLRPAKATDYDAIAAIWHAGASLPGVGPAAGLPTLPVLRARVDDEMATGWVVTVAEVDGQVAGFIALRPEAADLDQLFVSPDAIGAGIGKALFAEALAAMPDGFSLFTRPGNARARRFYEAAGMVLMREEVHPMFGDTILYYAWKPA